jgi:hypothetical protein
MLWLLKNHLSNGGMVSGGVFQTANPGTVNPHQFLILAKLPFKSTLQNSNIF